jgi:hypothetical protein
MPRIKHKIQEEHLNELKSLIEYTYGEKIRTVNDCNQLSTLIFEKVNSSISADTLRRLFGLVETNSKPSLYTLETLSKYVGFNNFQEFVNSEFLIGKHFLNNLVLECNSNKIMPNVALQAMQQKRPSHEYYSTLHQLIILAVQKKDILFFQNLYVNQNGFEWNEIYKYEIYQTIQIIGKFVEDHQWLQKIALENYFGLPYVFDYFIEWYVAEDELYYQKLIEKYHDFHVENPEKLIFYYSIKSVFAIRQNDFEKIKEYHQSIHSLEKKCTPNNILKARILGLDFVYNKMIQQLDAVDSLLKIDFDRLFPDIGDRVSSLFFLFTYLLEVEEYELMIQLFNKWLRQEVSFFSLWTRINWNQLCLLISYSYYQLEKKEQAKTYFTQIHPMLFETYHKKRLTVIYEKLKIHFTGI